MDKKICGGFADICARFERVFFCFFVLYRAIYALLEKKDSFAFCEDEKEIESVIGSEFFARLKEKQGEFYLDLNISIF